MEGKGRSAARGAMFVSSVSLLGFRRCTELLALRPPPEPFPNTSAYHCPLGNPQLDPDGFVPGLRTPRGAAITVTDTAKPGVGGVTLLLLISGPLRGWRRANCRSLFN